ncbi:MAG: hypothetical protein A2V90_08800 [Gammaproteobacteria bacterium RBG_16_57_12]|nr:MAG: hypothetical protein A2V90_08800 [Gammaproteobacteria bacterium RBG_16_57_12]
MAISTVREVLEFWFSLHAKPFWFHATPEFDQEVAAKFMATYQAAREGELSGWKDTAQGALALVIVLDQFPLHMFRGEAQSFATEAAARQVAERAIHKDYDRQLTGEQKGFLYLPYMHSESLVDQEMSVMLFMQAGLMDSLKWAVHHQDIIRRFGRFPHRNQILGRESTPQELEYLASKEALHG